MKLPFAENAQADIRKLVEYCLNPNHDEGKHKAHLFAITLGIGLEDAFQLRDAILQSVQTNEAQVGRRDDYGQRYTVDFDFEWKGKRATIRSGWIV